MRHTTISRLARVLVLVLSLLPGLAVAQQAAAPTFSKEQLEQMLAPIALYPDSLLSQILMAATYPADVAEAAKWSKANPNQKGDDAVKAVQSQPWDPSVQSLAAFPQVLDMMGAKPDWVQNVGDAFLASSKDVLDAVQRLRVKAQEAGNLKSTEQQKVVVEQAPQTQQTVIKIEPAAPETVYVPAYNPSVVYGTWAYPSYPPVYYPPPPYYYPGGALASGIMFGVGVAAVGSLWGDCNWGGGDVNINVNKYNNINTNRQINNTQNKFTHNSANRKGVPYRDSNTRQQYSKGVGDASQRSQYRGNDAGREAQRQQAQASLQQRGMDSGGAGSRDRSGGSAGGAQAGSRDRAGGGGGGGGAAQARPSAQTANRGGGDHAFSGARDAGASRQQADRGSASRQSMGQQRPAGGGARGGGRGR